MDNFEQLTRGLSKSELTEFLQAVDYLQQGVERGGVSEAGGASTVLNRMSPKVRERFNMIRELVAQPRFRPFAEKYSESEQLDKLGFDAALAQPVVDALDGNEVSARVLEKLGGSDANRPREPISRRDMVAAALEASNASQGSE